MKLGFVSAILPDRSLDEVISFAALEEFDCLELMCWPPGKADRRYAGVTHLDVTQVRKDNARQLTDRFAAAGIQISALGYYPNVLSPERPAARAAETHLKKVIRAAAVLGINVVTTFVGRDWTKTIDQNWPRFLKVWRPLVQLAEDLGVRLAIENCPMLFTHDEWPGGKNLAHSPAIWRRMFSDIPSASFGLNYDPSHLVWQQMDCLRPLREFGPRIFHVHAKDVRLDKDRLDQVGILAPPLEYHTPKLPGLGEVNWGRFFSILSDLGYRDAVCIEMEDRAYEGSMADRQAGLRQSASFLTNLMGRLRPKKLVYSVPAIPERL